MKSKQKLKGIVQGAVATALTVSMVASSMAANFVDTWGHWAESEIDRWNEEGVVMGYDGYYRPDNYIKRGDMAVMLDQVMEYQVDYISGNYIPDWFDDKNVNLLDMSSGNSAYYPNYYDSAIYRLHTAWLMIGSGDYYGTYVRPDDNITRQEAAVMLAKAFHLDTSYTPSSSFYSKFADSNEVSSWALNGVYAMTTANSYMLGRESSMFAPQEPITRAEVAQILDKMINAFVQNPVNLSGGTYNGNMVINTPSVNLSGDMRIRGDLIIAEGVADGDIHLTDVQVDGNIIIKGGSTNTIYLCGVTAAGMEVSRMDAPTLVVLCCATDIPEITVEHDCVIDATGLDDGYEVGKVELNGATDFNTKPLDVTVWGKVDDIINNYEPTNLTVSGPIGSITLNEDCTVNGTDYDRNDKVDMGTIPGTSATKAPNIVLNSVFPNATGSAMVTHTEPRLDLDTGDVTFYVYISSEKNCAIMSTPANAITVPDGVNLSIDVDLIDNGDDETFGTTVFKVTFNVPSNIEEVELDVNFKFSSDLPDITVEKNFSAVDNTNNDKFADVQLTNVELVVNDDGSEYIDVTVMVSGMDGVRLPTDNFSAVTIDFGSKEDEDDYPELLSVTKGASSNDMTAYSVKFLWDSQEYPDLFETLPLLVNFLDGSNDNQFASGLVTINEVYPDGGSATVTMTEPQLDDEGDVWFFTLKVRSIEDCKLADNAMDAMLTLNEDSDTVTYTVTFISETSTTLTYYVEIDYKSSVDEIIFDLNFVDENELAVPEDISLAVNPALATTEGAIGTYWEVGYDADSAYNPAIVDGEVVIYVENLAERTGYVFDETTGFAVADQDGDAVTFDWEAVSGIDGLYKITFTADNAITGVVITAQYMEAGETAPVGIEYDTTINVVNAKTGELMGEIRDASITVNLGGTGTNTSRRARIFTESIEDFLGGDYVVLAYDGERALLSWAGTPDAAPGILSTSTLGDYYLSNSKQAASGSYGECYQADFSEDISLLQGEGTRIRYTVYVVPVEDYAADVKSVVRFGDEATIKTSFGTFGSATADNKGAVGYEKTGNDVTIYPAYKETEVSVVATYTPHPTLNEDGDNYNFTMTTYGAMITVTDPESGTLVPDPDVETDFKLTVTEGVTVTPAPDSDGKVAAGTVVTVTPDEDKTVVSVTVYDENGDDITDEVKKNWPTSDDNYTFTMPSEDCKVEVEYEDEGDGEEEPEPEPEETYTLGKHDTNNDFEITVNGVEVSEVTGTTTVTIVTDSEKTVDKVYYFQATGANEWTELTATNVSYTFEVDADTRFQVTYVGEEEVIETSTLDVTIRNDLDGSATVTITGVTVEGSAPVYADNDEVPVGERLTIVASSKVGYTTTINVTDSNGIVGQNNDGTYTVRNYEDIFVEVEYTSNSGTAHTITVVTNPSGNGYRTAVDVLNGEVSVSEAESQTALTIDIQLPDGYNYTIDSVTLNYGGTNDLLNEAYDYEFTMPNQGVTIFVNYTEVLVEGPYTITMETGSGNFDLFVMSNGVESSTAMTSADMADVEAGTEIALKAITGETFQTVAFSSGVTYRAVSDYYVFAMPSDHVVIHVVYAEAEGVVYREIKNGGTINFMVSTGGTVLTDWTKAEPLTEYVIDADTPSDTTKKYQVKLDTRPDSVYDSPYYLTMPNSDVTVTVIEVDVNADSTLVHTVDVTLIDADGVDLDTNIANVSSATISGSVVTVTLDSDISDDYELNGVDVTSPSGLTALGVLNGDEIAIVLTGVDGLTVDTNIEISVKIVEKTDTGNTTYNLSYEFVVDGGDAVNSLAGVAVTFTGEAKENNNIIVSIGGSELGKYNIVGVTSNDVTITPLDNVYYFSMPDNDVLVTFALEEQNDLYHVTKNTATGNFNLGAVSGGNETSLYVAENSTVYVSGQSSVSELAYFTYTYEETGGTEVKNTSTATSFRMPGYDVEVQAFYQYPVTLDPDYGNATLSYSRNGGTDVTFTSGESVAEGDTVTVTVETGSTVKVSGVSGDVAVSGSGTSFTFTMPREAVTIQVMEQYSVSYDSNNPSSNPVVGYVGNDLVNNGDEVTQGITVSMAPRSGNAQYYSYRVVGDNTDTLYDETNALEATTVTWDFTMPAEDVTVYVTAVYRLDLDVIMPSDFSGTEPSVTLTVNGSVLNRTDLADGYYYYAEGTSVLVTAAGENGYTSEIFTAYVEGVSNTPETSATLTTKNDDMTVTVVYTSTTVAFKLSDIVITLNGNEDSGTTENYGITCSDIGETTTTNWLQFDLGEVPDNFHFDKVEISTTIDGADKTVNVIQAHATENGAVLYVQVQFDTTDPDFTGTVDLDLTINFTEKEVSLGAVNWVSGQDNNDNYIYRASVDGENVDANSSTDTHYIYKIKNVNNVLDTAFTGAQLNANKDIGTAKVIVTTDNGNSVTVQVSEDGDAALVITIAKTDVEAAELGTENLNIGIVYGYMLKGNQATSDGVATVGTYSISGGSNPTDDDTELGSTK